MKNKHLGCYEQLANRAKEVIAYAFGKDLLVAFEEEDQYHDGQVEIDRFSIAVVKYIPDNRRVTHSGSLYYPEEREGYQVYTTTHIPGVRYHSDGSGTPDDVSVDEYGKPHPTFDRALTVVLGLILKSSLEDFFEIEYEEKLAKEMEEEEEYWREMEKLPYEEKSTTSLKK